jgi:hypothetical protein
MGKIDFATLSSPVEATAKPFVIEHPSIPEPLHIFLRPLDELEEEKAAEIADKLVAKYVTGGWRDPNGEFNEQPRVFLIDDKPVQLSHRALYVMARIQVMQVPGKPEDRYMVEPDLIYMAKKRPEVWRLLQKSAMAVSAGDTSPKAED